jgi:hypothetical protein
MPTDVRFPFTFDETGDVATVDGDEFYRRHALQLALIVVEERLGNSLSSNALVEIQSRIERQFRRSPYFNNPSVTIVEQSVDGERIDVRVDDFNKQQFEIPVESPDRNE